MSQLLQIEAPHSRRKKVILLTIAAVVLLVVLVSMTSPASAGRNNRLSFAVDTTYDVIASDFIGLGTWSSDGVVSAGGDAYQEAKHIGDNDGWFRHVRTIDTLTDENGSITIRALATRYEGCPNCVSNSGYWVIVGGTGTYEDLRGMGRVKLSQANLKFPYFEVYTEYEGFGFNINNDCDDGPFCDDD